MRIQNILSLNQTLVILRSFPPKLTFNLKTFWLFTIALTIFLLALCIFQITAMFQNISFLQNYQKKLNNLSQENKNLTIQFSQNDSLPRLETLAKNLNFEKTNKIQYIQILENQIVSIKNK